MKNRQHIGHHLAHSDRGMASRVGYLGLLLAAFALMLLGKADETMMERVRASISDGVAPVLDVLSRPAATVDHFADQFNAMMNLREENAHLLEENKRLLEWQAAARKLSAENTQLKGLLNLSPGAEPVFISGRVIGDTGGAFVHSVLVSAGSRHGVSKGQAVLTGDGLVGRVQGVGARAARVLLLTDLNSRIPVVVEATRTRAILAGDNTDRPRLIHMPPGASVSTGDRIVTSGHGGAFPPGIPVGVVAHHSEGAVTVKPFVHRDRLEFVRVVDYGLRGILDATAITSGGVQDMSSSGGSK